VRQYSTPMHRTILL